MTYASVVTAQVLDTDKTVIDDLLGSSGRQFFDELNGYGTGRCALPIGDPQISEMLRGRYVRVQVGGTTRFTFKISGDPEYVLIEAGEENAEIVVFTGPGWGAVFDDSPVRPQSTAIAGIDYAYHYWSFAHIDFPNAGAWGSAQEMYEYLDGVSYGVRVLGQVDPIDDTLKLYPAPIEFPWPTAYHNGDGELPTPVYDPTYWIIADGAAEDDVGYHFFRLAGINLAGPQLTSIFVTADNYFTLYLNGIPILAEWEDEFMWQGWKEITVTLPTGTHYFAAVVENLDHSDIPYNPGGFLFSAVALSVYPGETATSLTLSLANSTDSWSSFFSADTWPGWDPGQIIDHFTAEAQSNDEMSAYAGGTWSGSDDSGGNTWDSSDPDTTIQYIPFFAMRVGQTGGDLLNELVTQGWIDYHFTPDTLELDAWGQGTGGTATGVEFERGVNLRGLTRAEAHEYCNALLIQYDGGFTGIVDAAAVTANNGIRVTHFLSTDARTEDEAKRQGRIELALAVLPQDAAWVLVVEPTSTDDCPYEAFGIGDTILVRNAPEDEFEELRVRSITCDEDEEGNAIWTVQAGARLRSPQRTMMQFLKSIGGKTLGVAGRGIARD